MRGGGKVEYGKMNMKKNRNFFSVEGTIFFNDETNQISWKDGLNEIDVLDVSNLTELRKETNTTLYIKSLDGNLKLTVNNDDQKRSLNGLYNHLLIHKSKSESQENLEDVKERLKSTTV